MDCLGGDFWRDTDSRHFGIQGETRSEEINKMADKAREFLKGKPMSVTVTASTGGQSGCTPVPGSPPIIVSSPDPAQSAPSAEPEILAEKFLYERLGFAFKAINDSLTVTIFRPKFRIFSFSQYDRKWDVVYLMDKAWDLLVELAAEKQAAALRTAQLERECEHHAEISRQSQLAELAAETRAETAQSALRQIREYVMIHFSHYLEGNADSKGKHHGIPATHFTGLRALLTVAAQTLEEK